MARKKKKKAGKSGSTWLITFSDMMTLMLTFFVLLVSMATIDERRRLVVLGSIIGTFGMGSAGYDERSAKDQKKTIEPGPLEDLENFQLLRDLLWEDLDQDINFQSNKYVQIVSINDEVFFPPGGFELTERGRMVLDRMLPILLRLRHPVLLAGHSAPDRDEVLEMAQVELAPDSGLDQSWRLSLYRVLTIYNHFLQRGLDPDLLRVEAFGKFRPMYSDSTPAGRRNNRRVDIVLDKRNEGWLEKLQPAPPPRDREFIINDFRFNVDVQGGPPQRPEQVPGTAPREP